MSYPRVFCPKCFQELSETSIAFDEDNDQLEHFGTPCTHVQYDTFSECCNAPTEEVWIEEYRTVCSDCKSECLIEWPGFTGPFTSQCCFANVISMTKEDCL